MAASAVQVNAGALVFAKLWLDFLDSLAAGTKVNIHFVPSHLNGVTLPSGTAFPPQFATDGSGELCNKYVYTIKKANSTDNMVYFLPGVDIGGVPLFWKVSSGADSLAES